MCTRAALAPRDLTHCWRVDPSFEAPYGVKIVRDFAGWRIWRLNRPGVQLPGGRTDFPERGGKRLPDARVETLLASLQALRFVVWQPGETGLDGSQTTLELQWPGGGIQISWWNDPPEAWAGLRALEAELQAILEAPIETRPT